MTGRRNRFSGICAALLAFAMVLTGIPQTAYAAEVISIAEDGDIVTDEVLMDDNEVSGGLAEEALLPEGDINDNSDDMGSDTDDPYSSSDDIGNEGAVHDNWGNIESFQYGRYRISGSWSENQLLVGNTNPPSIGTNQHKKEQMWIFSKVDAEDSGYNRQELYVIYPYTDTNWSSPSSGNTGVLDAVGNSSGLSDGEGVGLEFGAYGTSGISLGMTNKWMISTYKYLSEKDGYVLRTGIDKDIVLTFTDSKDYNPGVYPISMRNYYPTVVAQIQHWNIDPAYFINKNNTTNGTLTINGDWDCAVEGEEVRVTATPNANYELDKLTYSFNGNTYDITSSKAFNMPAGDVTVNATFKAITATKPVITQQPSDLELYAGTQGKLSVVAPAISGHTLSYQWQSYVNSTWTDISGATGKDYTFTPTAEGTARYRCKVRSQINGKEIYSDYVYSEAAYVRVTYAKPVITSQPSDLELYAGTHGKLRIVATAPVGYGLEYQWQSGPDRNNMTDIEGATASEYAFTPTTAGKTYYACKVRTGKGTSTGDYVLSDKAIVTVKEAVPVITQQPSDLNLTFTDSGILRIVATAPEGYTLSYLWEKKEGNDYTQWRPESVSADHITYVADDVNELGTNIIRCKVISSITVGGDTIKAYKYSNDIKLVVSPKTAEVTLDPLPKTLSFNTVAQELVTAGDCVNATMNYAVLGEGELPGVATVWSAEIPKKDKVGKYYVWYYAKAADNSGYVDSQKRYVVSAIEKTPTGVEVQGMKLTYTNAEQDLAQTVGTVPAGVSVSYSMDGGVWSNEVPKAKAADVYTVFWKIDGGNNYLSTSGRVVSSIGKDVITPSITDYAGVYDGKGHTIMVSVNNLDADPEITYSLVEKNPIYENSVSVKDVTAGTKVYFRIRDKKGNYEDVNSYGTVTITPKTLTVTASANTIIYGDAPAGNDVIYDGFAEGDSKKDLSGRLDYDFTYERYGNVGNNYEIMPKGLEALNYAFDYKPGTLTVEQKEIGLDWGQTVFTYNKEQQGPDPVATGTVNGDQIGVVAEGNRKTDTGTYTATAKSLTGEKAGNYKLPSPATAEYRIVMGQSEIVTPPMEIEGIVYDGSAHRLVSDNAVAKNGRIQYSVATRLVEDQTKLEWSTQPPEGTDAKTYYVYYMSKGYPSDGYLDDYCDAPVVVSIDKAAPLPISDTPITLSRSVNEKDLKLWINKNGKWPAYYGKPEYTWHGASNVAYIVNSIIRAGATTGNGYAMINIPETENAYGCSGEIKVTVNGQNQDDPVEDGKITASFAEELETVSINGAQYTYLIYTGDNLMPELIVRNGTKTLVKGNDYTLKYSDNKNANAVIGYEGTEDTITGKVATVTVQGKGNYNDKKVLNFLIAKADIENAEAGNTVVLARQKASPVLTYKGITLRKGKDFTGDFSPVFIDPNLDNKIKVNGNGNFIGSKTIPIMVVPVKRKLNVSIADVNITYNGEEHTLTENQLIVTDKGTGARLTKDEDYTVSYSDSVNAGNVKVVITGMGAYTGTVKKTFKIKPARYARFEITNEDELINEGVDFTNIGAVPNIYVTADLDAEHLYISLVNGRDFKVTYSNNKNAGFGKATIRFIGNYAGAQSIIQYFKINKLRFEEGEDSGIVVADNLVYSPSKKKMGAYFPKVGTNLFVVMNGVLIKANECILSFYSDADCEAEHLIDKNSPVSFGEGEDEITVYVKSEPKAGNANFDGGSLTGSFKIVTGDGLVDASKAKISVVDKNTGRKAVIRYTGEKIEFANDDEFSQGYLKVVIRNGKQDIVLIENGVDGQDQVSDFFNIKYVNNVRKGTAYVIISAKEKADQPEGRGYNFAGSAKGSFTISQMGLKEMLKELLKL